MYKHSAFGWWYFAVNVFLKHVLRFPCTSIQQLAGILQRSLHFGMCSVSHAQTFSRWLVFCSAPIFVACVPLPMHKPSSVGWYSAVHILYLCLAYQAQHPAPGGYTAVPLCSLIRIAHFFWLQNGQHFVIVPLRKCFGLNFGSVSCLIAPVLVR